MSILISILFFGLSKMLSEYQIENAGLRISNKEEGIKTLEAPFIAHTGDEFVTVYLNSSMDESKKTYADWFQSGKYRKEDFFQRYPQNIETPLVEAEFEHHKAWKEAAGLSATPTLLVNGYVLPRDYRIEDLSYFTEIDVDSIANAKP